MAGKIGYRWHLRRLMADQDMYANYEQNFWNAASSSRSTS